MNSVEDTISKFEEFLRLIHAPVRISELDNAVNKKDLLEVAVNNRISGEHHKLSASDLEALYDLMV